MSDVTKKVVNKLVSENPKAKAAKLTKKADGHNATVNSIVNKLVKK